MKTIACRNFWLFVVQLLPFLFCSLPCLFWFRISFHYDALSFAGSQQLRDWLDFSHYRESIRTGKCLICSCRWFCKNEPQSTWFREFDKPSTSFFVRYSLVTLLVLDANPKISHWFCVIKTGYSLETIRTLVGYTYPSGPHHLHTDESYNKFEKIVRFQRYNKSNVDL